MIVLSVLNTFAASVAMAVAVWIGLKVVGANAATRYWTWWAVLGALAAVLWWPRSVEPVAASPVPIEVAPRIDWFVWMILAWATFAAYRLLRLAFSYLQLRRTIGKAHAGEQLRLDQLRIQHGVHRPVRLLLSERISAPMSAGYVSASILLPKALGSQLTSAELDHVLLHELAHTARRDDWTKLAARLAGAVLGLHPVAAFALARMEKERELACDDWVAAATGDPRGYASSLARVFEVSRGGSETLATGMTGPKLGDRVEQLLTAGRRFTRGASLATLLVLAAALAGIVGAEMHSPAWVAFAQQPPLPPTPPQLPVAPTPPVAPVAPVPPAPPRGTITQLLDRQADVERMRVQLETMAANMRAAQQAMEVQNKALQERLAEMQQRLGEQSERERSLQELKALIQQMQRRLEESTRR